MKNDHNLEPAGEKIKGLIKELLKEVKAEVKSKKKLDDTVDMDKAEIKFIHFQYNPNCYLVNKGGGWYWICDS